MSVDFSISGFLWEKILGLQLVTGTVKISWYSKRDATSIEFAVFSFLREKVSVSNSLREQILHLQLSMGENFQSPAFSWSKFYISSFLQEKIFSLQLSQGANSTSPAFYGRKFQSLAFSGSKFYISNFLREKISVSNFLREHIPHLQLSTGENLSLQLAMGTLSPISNLQLSTGVRESRTSDITNPGAKGTSVVKGMTGKREIKIGRL
ncbi:hypothetical protein V6N13_001678 [Hibiscus sabdariffa]